MAEQTYHRVDLAVEQLDLALSLFLNKQSYVSALTLAGAAEEILGQSLKTQEQQNFLQYKYEALEPTRKFLHGGPLAWKDYVKGENRVRDAAKHMRPEETTVTCDLEDEALWMIVRACHNFDRLDLPPTEKMREFENWFYRHVVGY